MKTRQDAADHMEAELRNAVRGRNQEDVSLAYSRLGLLPEKTDLRHAVLSFYSSQALAFYDSRAKEIVVIDNTTGEANGASSRKIDDRAIAHELTHALQDQVFSLGVRLRSETNGDAAIALRAVAEGDALVSEHAYAVGALDKWLVGYVLQRLEPGNTGAMLPDVPALMLDRSDFQYRAGTRFVLRSTNSSDWSLVNRLYTHPPLSTEQVLHPEKYFETPDPPSRIDLGNLSALFSSEWKEIENDTLGELLVRCLFNQWLGPTRAAAISAGWDGDRFVAYRKGDDVAFIWATIWDSSADAREFYEGYQELLSHKSTSLPKDSHVYIERRDRTVIVVEGFDPGLVKNQVQTVWSEMITQEEIFQPPPSQTIATQ
jgi:hypothetical protein